MTFVKTQTLEERFNEKVDKSGDCWLWTATIQSWGYGTLWRDGKNVLAHRIAWELAYGPIPDGGELHHTCFTKHCVNPEHLELMMSRREHWQVSKHTQPSPIAENALKTHCKHGHPLSGDNLIEYVTNSPTRKGPIRKCRTCERARQKRQDARRKAERHARKAAQV